jgi:hypothetical protein
MIARVNAIIAEKLPTTVKNFLKKNISRKDFMEN